MTLQEEGESYEGLPGLCNYCDRVSYLYRLFTPTTLTLVTHNLSHAVL